MGAHFGLSSAPRWGGVPLSLRYASLQCANTFVPPLLVHSLQWSCPGSPRPASRDRWSSRALRRRSRTHDCYFARSGSLENEIGTLPRVDHPRRCLRKIPDRTRHWHSSFRKLSSWQRRHSDSHLPRRRRPRRFHQLRTRCARWRAATVPSSFSSEEFERLAVSCSEVRRHNSRSERAETRTSHLPT